MNSLDQLYAGLVQKFPALYQLMLWQDGRVNFQRVNPAARENAASVGKAFSAPPETFQHRFTRCN